LRGRRRRPWGLLLGKTVRKCRCPLACSLILVALLLLGAGCGDEVSSEVKGLLAEANNHLEKSAAATLKLEEFQKDWGNLAASAEVTGDTIAEAMALVDVAQKNLVEALEELKAAEKAMQGVKGSDVSKEMKTYTDMKLDAMEEQEKMLELELRAMTIRVQALSEPESEILRERLVEYERQIAELNEEAREHASRAQSLHIDANEYYDEKIKK